MTFRSSVVLSVLPLLLLLVNVCSGLQVHFRAVVDARAHDCFHQALLTNQTVETDFLVVSGGDVTFAIRAPVSQRLVHSEARSQMGRATFKTDSHGAGDYSFCFDNGHSLMHSVQVRITNRQGF